MSKRTSLNISNDLHRLMKANSIELTKLVEKYIPIEASKHVFVLDLANYAFYDEGALVKITTFRIPVPNRHVKEVPMIITSKNQQHRSFIFAFGRQHDFILHDDEKNMIILCKCLGDSNDASAFDLWKDSVFPPSIYDIKKEEISFSKEDLPITFCLPLYAHEISTIKFGESIGTVFEMNKVIHEMIVTREKEVESLYEKTEVYLKHVASIYEDALQECEKYLQTNYSDIDPNVLTKFRDLIKKKKLDLLQYWQFIPYAIAKTAVSNNEGEEHHDDHSK